ncbi:hypothetical protein D3C76_1346760 [compost metagenome]
MPPGHDKALADIVSSIFSCMVGIRTGINPQLPKLAYTSTQLHQDAANASKSTQERALIVEIERKRLVKAAVSQAAAVQEQADQAERDRNDRAKQQRQQRLPSWKRNGHDLDDQDICKPGRS